MKWWTTILSLYLLGLALWPCSDERLLVTCKATTAVALFADTQRTGSAHHPHDQCTPLCTCTCCAVAITVVPRFNYSITLPVNALPNEAARFHYAPAHWAAPLAAIWQPPQIRI